MSSPESTRTGSGNGEGKSPAAATFMTQPFTASRKVYLGGTMPEVRVPMREISLTPTRTTNGDASSPNPSVTVYDTSGPYTDPSEKIDIRAGLVPRCQNWILSRN